MQQVITSLLLIALGMAVDAWYQHKIRVAECNAYETGYQQGKHEEQIRGEERAAQAGLVTVQGYDPQQPSMAAPVSLPDTFAERMQKHGRATVWMKKGGKRYEYASCSEHDF